MRSLNSEGRLFELVGQPKQGGSLPSKARLIVVKHAGVFTEDTDLAELVEKCRRGRIDLIDTQSHLEYFSIVVRHLLKLWSGRIR